MDDENAIKVWVSPQRVRRYVESRVGLLCEVDHTSEYTVEWTFYGQSLPNNAQRMYDMEIVIESLTEGNAGEYMCLVRDGDNWNSAIAVVEVLG